jgi:hypothetical protein
MGESATKCGSCPVPVEAPCLGLEVRKVPTIPDRLCELAATDPRYALELRRRAGEPLPAHPPRR